MCSVVVRRFVTASLPLDASLNCCSLSDVRLSVTARAQPPPRSLSCIGSMVRGDSVAALNGL